MKLPSLCCNHELLRFDLDRKRILSFTTVVSILTLGKVQLGSRTFVLISVIPCEFQSVFRFSLLISGLCLLVCSLNFCFWRLLWLVDCYTFTLALWRLLVMLLSGFSSQLSQCFYHQLQLLTLAILFHVWLLVHSRFLSFAWHCKLYWLCSVLG